MRTDRSFLVSIWRCVGLADSGCLELLFTLLSRTLQPSCDARSRVLRECKHRLVKLFVAWVGIYKGQCRSSPVSLFDLCLMNQQGT